MNQEILEKIDYFVEHCPYYSDGVVHAADRHRLYDIVLAVKEKNESIEDTKEILKKKISSASKFHKEERVIAESISNLDVVYMFLQYFETKK